MTIKYHFFGRDLIIDREFSNRSNLIMALEKQGFKTSHVLFVSQIHGNQVVVVDDDKKIYGEQNLPKADAIVTNLKNVNIAIITADCSPILLFDAKNNVVGAAHAGWRGAKSGVIANVVSEMKKLGAENISAIVGPMIQQESYEVSREFFDDFLNEDKANSKFFKSGEKADKYLFDLPSYVESKLRAAGVLEIKNDRIDTYKNSETLFSFRRSTHLGEKDCGRNVSVICLARLR
jgi:YfiH family protein